jgi:predicted TIM-barrel fold metal-dependent hydrolase
MKRTHIKIISGNAGRTISSVMFEGSPRGRGRGMMERLLLVSADGHITMPPEVVPEYLDSKHHQWYGDYLQDVQETKEKLWFFRLPPEALEVIDPEHLISSGGDIPWDLDRRIVEMDREGIVAEALFPQDLYAPLPFFDHMGRPYGPDLRQAGVTAYHRYVAEVMAGASGRLFGIANSGPCLDMDATIQELRWVAAHGFRSVSVPGFTSDDTLPPLSAPYYEPFWAACADLGLVLSVHAGHGRAQGEMVNYVDRLVASVGEDATHQQLLTAHKAGLTPGSPFHPSLVPQEVFWHLIMGGVFDRHPTLMLAFTEVRCDWVPATLRYLDERFEAGDLLLTRRPSEYWRHNCMTGASSIKRSEVRLRHEVGVEKMMFGRDYPHREGTWPNTWDWIRDALADMDEEEARQLLGENAVSLYGLDRPALAALAEKIGPLPSEVLGGGYNVDPNIVTNFNQRSGYDRSHENVDLDALARVVGV